MGTSTFGKGFDMESLLNKKLMEIDDLNSRRYARDVLKDVFSELCKYTKTAYQQLEQQTARSLCGGKDYEIVTGIADRQQYDVTDDGMFPMSAKDLEQKPVDAKQMLKCIRESKRYPLFSVFLEAEHAVIRRLEADRGEFCCRIQTGGGEYSGTVSIVPQKKYEKIIAGLFHTFQENGVPYHSPCAPYLKKFFEVYAKTADPLTGEEEILSVTVDFREYEPYVRYHRFPVWNLQTVTVPADVRPKACIDRIHYCHTVNGKRLDKNSFYLVSAPEAGLLEVSRGEDLGIITEIPEKKQWQLVRLKDSPKENGYGPLFTNKSRSKRALARTEAGIFRFINLLGYQDYAVLKKIRILSEYRGELCTYCSDPSVYEEISMPHPSGFLLLEFEAVKPSDYLLHDIISYLVTALQRECREYKCIGTVCES